MILTIRGVKMCEINRGDDVTINGTVIDVKGNVLIVRLKSGELKDFVLSDINTIRPKVVVGDTDMRKGN